MAEHKFYVTLEIEFEPDPFGGHVEAIIRDDLVKFLNDAEPFVKSAKIIGTTKP